LYEVVAARGGRLRRQVRRLEFVPAEDVVSGQVDVTPGAPGGPDRRLRFFDEDPWVVKSAEVVYDV
jgi:GntR family transcriptional regulator